ncbi:hypothetical protein ACRB68_73570 [Actinomadura sp. RB68]|uniref:DDE Tnp4 domain-containing protein n=1 Tax=Actinomadura macrotermitis TaxID=2585200 RepID=A0A7K0C804_9ACTN|nr:hypothetical protein [Actinomadura macrotermitis]
MADGGYQGNQQVIMPYRRPRDGGELPAWQHDLNTIHKQCAPASGTSSHT